MSVRYKLLCKQKEKGITYNMFNLPLEMVHYIIAYLSYEDIIAVQKAFPEYEEQVYAIKYKKGSKKIRQLDDEMQMMKVKFKKRERDLQNLLEMGHCFLHLKSTALKVYAALQKMVNIKRRKQQIEAELNAEEIESIDELVLRCYVCGTIFPTYELARSHFMDLSGYC